MPKQLSLAAGEQKESVAPNWGDKFLQQTTGFKTLSCGDMGRGGAHLAVFPKNLGQGLLEIEGGDSPCFSWSLSFFSSLNSVRRRSRFSQKDLVFTGGKDFG